MKKLKYILATVLNVLAAALFLLFAGDRQQKFDTIMTNTQQRYIEKRNLEQKLEIEPHFILYLDSC